MSWLFGLNKNDQIPVDAPQVPVLGGEEGEGGAGAVPVGQSEEGYRSEAYSFDSSALERAAKAAKELERSKYANQALELSKKQEETKQQEQMVKIKEYELNIEQMKIEGKKVDHQEKRKNMEIEADQAKRKAEYQDQLARRRYNVFSDDFFLVLKMMSKVNLVNLRTHETSTLYSDFYFQRTKFNG